MRPTHSPMSMVCVPDQLFLTGALHTTHDEIDTYSRIMLYGVDFAVFIYIAIALTLSRITGAQLELDDKAQFLLDLLYSAFSIIILKLTMKKI